MEKKLLLVSSWNTVGWDLTITGTTKLIALLHIAYALNSKITSYSQTHNPFED